MVLSFKEKFPNSEPTYFIEKIWRGLLENKLATEYQYNDYAEQYFLKFDKYWDGYLDEDKEFLPKIHTIREDLSDRWKVGNSIQMVVNNRTKDRFQFAPDLVCKSTQKIKMNFESPRCFYPLLKMEKKTIDVYKKENQLFEKLFVFEKLFLNDGFLLLANFFEWFNRRDFSGKIIHWTDFKY